MKFGLVHFKSHILETTKPFEVCGKYNTITNKKISPPPILVNYYALGNNHL